MEMHRHVSLGINRYKPYERYPHNTTYLEVAISITTFVTHYM